MLRCPEVRIGNNRSPYFDFFFPPLQPSIVKYLLFLKRNRYMCFTATECQKSEFFVLIKLLKGSYFRSVVFQ